MLVSDLDGTLLDSKQQISTENLEAIQTLKNNGGSFTIASGRMVQAAMPYIEQLKIDIPVILYNGAVIYDPVERKIMMKKSLTEPKQVMRMIKPYTALGEVGILFYHDADVYALEKNSVVRAYENKEKVVCKIFSEELLEKPIIKILMISHVPSILTQCEVMLMASNYPCELVYSESNYLEILPETASKGTALLTLQEYLQPSNFHTICVGDNLNDLSMLQAASKGFFVENSHALLKQSEFYHCVHHEQHAIADIIYNHILPVKM